MPKCYSGDLQERVIEAVEMDGVSRREAAERFDVSVSSAVGAALEREPERGAEATRRKRLSVGSARGADIGPGRRTAGPDVDGDRCGAAQATGFEPAGVRFRVFLADTTSPRVSRPSGSLALQWRLPHCGKQRTAYLRRPQNTRYTAQTRNPVQVMTNNVATDKRTIPSILAARRGFPAVKRGTLESVSTGPGAFIGKVTE
jgi:hypothetical protein